MQTLKRIIAAIALRLRPIGRVKDSPTERARKVTAELNARIPAQSKDPIKAGDVCFWCKRGTLQNEKEKP